MREIIIAIDKITAYVALSALFTIIVNVLVKIIIKKKGVKEFDNRLAKIHKIVTNILFTSGIIHMCTSFVYISELGIVPYMIGLTLLLTTIVAVRVINNIIYQPISRVSIY